MERVKYLAQKARRIAILAAEKDRRLRHSPPLVTVYTLQTLDADPHLSAQQLIARIKDAPNTDTIQSLVSQTAAAVRNRRLPLRPELQGRIVLRAVNEAYWKCAREADAERDMPMRPGHDWESASDGYLRGRQSQPDTLRSSR